MPTRRKYSCDRRDLLKTATAGLAAGSLGLLSCRASETDAMASDAVTFAGYEYDRVRGIPRGSVGLQGHDVSFTVEDIYNLNRQVFGPAQTYHVSEVGLIPYVMKRLRD